MKYDLRVVKVLSLCPITETQTSLTVTKLGGKSEVLRCNFEHSKNPNLRFMQNMLVIAAVNLKSVRSGGSNHNLGLLYKKTADGVILPILPKQTIEGDLIYFDDERLPEIRFDEIETKYKQSDWVNDLNEFDFNQDVLRCKGKILQIKDKGPIKTKKFKLVD